MGSEAGYLVDILICAYNHEKYIGAAIESVLVQKCDFKYRLFIGEDFSTDGTRKIIEKYARSHPDIIFPFYHQRNLGSAGNTEFLLSICTSRYIALLDGDDFWCDSEKLRRQVDVLEHNRDCVVCHHWHTMAVPSGNGDFELIDAPKTNVGFLDCKDATVKEIFENKLRAKSRTLMFRNVFRDGLQLPEWFFKVKFGDVPLTMILGKFGKFYFINEPMAVYRQTNKGISTEGKGNRLYFFNHYLEWVRIWEFGSIYYDGKYEKEALNTISHFYGLINKNYGYRLNIFLMTLKYAFFESQFPFFLRSRISARLFKDYIFVQMKRKL